MKYRNSLCSLEHKKKENKNFKKFNGCYFCHGKGHIKYSCPLWNEMKLQQFQQWKKEEILKRKEFLNEENKINSFNNPWKQKITSIMFRESYKSSTSKISNNEEVINNLIKEFYREMDIVVNNYMRKFNELCRKIIKNKNNKNVFDIIQENNVNNKNKNNNIYNNNSNGKENDNNKNNHNNNNYNNNNIEKIKKINYILKYNDNIKTNKKNNILKYKGNEVKSYNNNKLNTNKIFFQYNINTQKKINNENNKNEDTINNENNKNEDTINNENNNKNENTFGYAEYLLLNKNNSNKNNIILIDKNKLTEKNNNINEIDKNNRNNILEENNDNISENINSIINSKEINKMDFYNKNKQKKSMKLKFDDSVINEIKEIVNKRNKLNNSIGENFKNEIINNKINKNEEKKNKDNVLNNNEEELISYSDYLLLSMVNNTKFKEKKNSDYIAKEDINDFINVCKGIKEYNLIKNKIYI